MTELLSSVNPRTGEVIDGGVPRTGPDALNTVVAAAQRAFPAWSRTAASERAGALRLVADRMEAARDELVAIADLETALGVPRLSGEVARTTGQLRLFADLIENGAYRDVVISPGRTGLAHADLRRILLPRGPVAVFAASNFPFAFSVAGGDTASALAAGCPVVLKAHEGHPATSRATAGIVSGALADAGAPAGTFAVVYGPAVGAPLVDHPAISAVGFTGSLRGGRALFDRAAARPGPIPFFGELGSVNPVVLLPAASANRSTEIARGYVESLTLGTGQFCTNPGLLFAPVGGAVLDELARLIGAAPAGPMLTERIAEGYRNFAEWDGLPTVALGSEPQGPFEVRPEVRRVALDDFAARTERLTEERFGPAGLIVTYDDPSRLPAALSRLPGSLTATIHADEPDHPLARELAAVLQHRAGRLIFNGWPTGVAVSWAQHHGGPWPASTDPAHTSVGARAINRWLVPVAYQGWPDGLLPAELQAANPLEVPRVVEPDLS